MEALRNSAGRGDELFTLLARHNVLLPGRGASYSWSEIEPDRVVPITVGIDYARPTR